MLLPKPFILGQILLSIQIASVNSHGFLFEPAGRASAWRKHFKTPEDYDDDGLFCGGFNSFWELNGGKCGVCGDAFEAKHPRPHEVGGRYVTRPPTITATYEQGDIIDVTVNLTANHGGFFVFQLCPADDPAREVDEHCLNGNNLLVVREQSIDDRVANSIELNLNVLERLERNVSEEGEQNRIDDGALLTNLTDDSFESYEAGPEAAGELNDAEIGNQIADRIHLHSDANSTRSRYNLFNPVDLDDHSYDQFKYRVPFESARSYAVKVKLPNEISCERCVFRWIYVTGNTWDTNQKGIGRTGNGKQEEFRNCADIRIH